MQPAKTGKRNRTLTYDANGGKATPQAESGKADGKWYDLSSQPPIHDKADYEGEMVKVIFLGWMTEANDGKIYKKGDEAPQTVERVRFNGEDLAVYAAWGYDADGNDDPAAFGDANRLEQGESTQENPRTGDADNLVLRFAMLGISYMGFASAAV